MMNRKQRRSIQCPKCGRRSLMRPFSKETGKRVDDPLYCKNCKTFVVMHPTDPESVTKAEPVPEVKEGTDG